MRAPHRDGGNERDERGLDQVAAAPGRRQRPRRRVPRRVRRGPPGGAQPSRRQPRCHSDAPQLLLQDPQRARQQVEGIREEYLFSEQEKRNCGIQMTLLCKQFVLV